MSCDIKDLNDDELVHALKNLIAMCLLRARAQRSIWSYPMPQGEMAQEAYYQACAEEDERGQLSAEDYLIEEPTFQRLRAEVKRRGLAGRFTKEERGIVVDAAHLLRLPRHEIYGGPRVD